MRRFKLEYLPLLALMFFLKGCHQEPSTLAGGGVEVGNAYESTHTDALNPAPLAEVTLPEPNNGTQVLRLYPDGKLESTALDSQGRPIAKTRIIPDAGPGLTARLIPIGVTIKNAARGLRLNPVQDPDHEDEGWYIVSDDAGQRQPIELATAAAIAASETTAAKVTLEDLRDFGRFLKTKVRDFRSNLSARRCAGQIVAQAFAF